MRFKHCMMVGFTINIDLRAKGEVGVELLCNYLRWFYDGDPGRLGEVTRITCEQMGDAVFEH